MICLRTFSKIYGLAALRLGWMYAPAHVVEAINRIRGPFNVNGPAIAAGVAALADTAHLEKARAHNERWLGWLTEEIGKLGLKVTPSVANFILIHFPSTPGRTATDANKLLTARGLLLRQVGSYKLPDALRMTVGTEEANRLVVKTLEDCYRAVGVVHTTWKVVPNRFKDYISVPKYNDYRSIHTTIVGPSRQRVELPEHAREDPADRGHAADLVERIAEVRVRYVELAQPVDVGGLQRLVEPDDAQRRGAGVGRVHRPVARRTAAK